MLGVLGQRGAGLSTVSSAQWGAREALLAMHHGALHSWPFQIATTRKLTVHLRPPASCDLEITLQGIKLILTVNEYSREEEVSTGCCWESVEVVAAG